MAFFKTLTVVVAFATVLLLDLTIKADACRCMRPSVCQGFKTADVVIRGIALSRSNLGRDYVTYTLKLTKVYKGDPDVELGEEISFTTASSRPTCGVTLELEEENLVGLYQHVGDDDDANFTANACGLERQWNLVTKEEQASLEDGCKTEQCDGAGCESDNCNGACTQFQECLLHSDHLGDEYYCADVCNPTPCGPGEDCTLEQIWQCVRAPCPPSAVCT